MTDLQTYVFLGHRRRDAEASAGDPHLATRFAGWPASPMASAAASKGDTVFSFYRTRRLRTHECATTGVVLFERTEYHHIEMRTALRGIHN